MGQGQKQGGRQEATVVIPARDEEEEEEDWGGSHDDSEKWLYLKGNMDRVCWWIRFRVGESNIKLNSKVLAWATAIYWDSEVCKKSKLGEEMGHLGWDVYCTPQRLCKVHSWVYKSGVQERAQAGNVNLEGAHTWFLRPWSWVRSERQWVERREVRKLRKKPYGLLSLRVDEEKLSKERKKKQPV